MDKAIKELERLSPVNIVYQKPNAVTIARHCKSFLPTLNPECVKWPVRCRCTAEKETDSIGQEK